MCFNDQVIHRDQIWFIKSTFNLPFAVNVFWIISIYFGPNQLLKWTYYHFQIFLSMAVIIYTCVYIMT